MPGHRIAVVVLLLLSMFGQLPFAAAQTPLTAWGYGIGYDNGFDAAASDATGNVYMVGRLGNDTTIGGTALSRISDQFDLLVVKLDPGGNPVWARNFGGPAGGGQVRQSGIAVDPAGNVLVTGSFSVDQLHIGSFTVSPPEGNGQFVAKLGPDGTAIWVTAFGPVAVAGGLSLDASGNPVVTAKIAASTASPVQFHLGGETVDRIGTQDLLIAKLARDSGDPIWVRNFDARTAAGATSGVDGAGNVHVFGRFSFGTMVFGGGALTLDASSATALFLAKLDPAGNPLWARQYNGTNINLSFSSAAVDSAGNNHFTVSASTMDIGGVIASSPAASALIVAKIDSAGDTVWARAFGVAGTDARSGALALDTRGDVYVTGNLVSGTLPMGPDTLAKLGNFDMVTARLAGRDGAPVWARNYAGETSTVVFPYALAVTGSSNVVVGGVFYSGNLHIGSAQIALPNLNTNMGFAATFSQTYNLTTAVAGIGRVTSSPAGIDCGATCTAPFVLPWPVTLTAVPGSGQVFSSWSGACSGTSPTTTVAMDAARSCTATFAAPPAPAPPAPPPSFVSPTNPPPPVVTVETSGMGQGRFSLAGSFTGPGLTFAAAPAAGGALPDWLQFDPATASFSYTLPLPGALPTGDARAARTTSNPVFPPAVLVQTVPITLTVAGGGQTYAVNIDLDFHAPRTPTAMTAISLAPNGAGGDARSARPSLSWDGGQVVFETGAGNINPASGGFGSIARYHGLSGKRDLLSQTAVPGGGVANGAAGNSTNPAVAASGSHAVFSSDAPGLSVTPNGNLRQVYRTDLAYPRVPLNEVATPAAMMVSITAAGIAADAPADLPAISEHGGFVAFESAAGNLGDNPGRHVQVWRKDMDGGAIALVSSTADGVAGNGDSRNVSLSWDGRFAVFDSTATNLVPGSGGRQIYLKDMANGLIYRLSTAAGSMPKIDARATGVVYVSAGRILRYDIGSGATTRVADDADQPSVSADGRFVVYRSAGQIHVADVMRGAVALVSQTAAGLPGNGASSDPAISGDGSTIAFASLARDLVNGSAPAGQVHLAGNPLVLPGRTAYWYTTDGGNLTWSIERWGDKALIAGLAYNANGGTAVWAAGSCQFSGLTCQGSVSQWRGQGQASTPVGPVTLTFAADGRTAMAALGGAAARNLAIYPVGGPRTTGFAGLPQDGYWGVSGNGPGISSLFIDTDTQVTVSGASSQVTHVTLFGYDAQGNAQWYAAEGALGTDQTFTGTLYLYAGGSSWTGAAGSNAPSATALGTLRLTFTTTDRATVQLPDGRTAAIARWRF